MSETDKKFRRQISLILLSTLLPVVLVVIWSLISTHFAVLNIQEYKVDRAEMYDYYTDVMVMVEAKNATWDAYIKANDKDKAALMHRIESLETQIYDLFRANNPVRGEEEEGSIYNQDVKP